MTAQAENDSSKELLDDHRTLEPPDPFPNSEVKRCIADGSVGSPHVRVGHRQAPIAKSQIRDGLGFFIPEACNSSVMCIYRADSAV